MNKTPSKLVGYMVFVAVALGIAELAIAAKLGIATFPNNTVLLTLIITSGTFLGLHLTSAGRTTAYILNIHNLRRRRLPDIS
ncbi:MAG: hypothetical protein ACE5KA_08890 [Nitrososphaerales archaeon]